MFVYFGIEIFSRINPFRKHYWNPPLTSRGVQKPGTDDINIKNIPNSSLIFDFLVITIFFNFF